MTDIMPGQDDCTGKPDPMSTTDEYADFSVFADKYPDLDYYRFDWCCVHELNLFALKESFDFDAVLRISDAVTEALPSIKRILAHPTLYLKVTEDILPVESVQIINNRTVDHAVVHSELWDNVTDNGHDRELIPRRLLTLRNLDEYAIYENVALTWLLYRILEWLRRYIRICKDLLYADRVLDMNVLGRSDHLYHYLAIGKIHTGYIRGFDKYRDATERCLNHLMYVYNAISGRMGCPLVTACRPRTARFTLHKTNLFRMHRDYRAVFRLCRLFNDLPNESEAGTDQEQSGEGYRIFCTTLALFAAGHFNFIAGQDVRFSLRHPEMTFTFKEWTLHLQEASSADGIAYGGADGLLMSVCKDAEYRMLLIPNRKYGVDRRSTDTVIQRFKAAVSADEYIPVSDEPETGDLCVSLTDIESFRRIQQLILRGMVCADRTYTVCPFCGHPLSMEDDTSAHVCSSCRTRIEKRVCPDSGLTYMATSIDKQPVPLTEPSENIVRKSAWVYDRIAESSMHFRNITPITAACDIICPHCGKVHM